MKSYIFPLFLQIMGLLVIIAEIFIPSLGLLTVIALGIFIYSLYIVFTTISTTVGMVFAGLDIVLVPVLIIGGMKILARSPLALKRELSKKDGVVSQKEDYDAYIDVEGLSITDLRPAGMAEINGQRLDVVADGEYIEAKTPIIVTGVTGNRIVVEKII